MLSYILPNYVDCPAKEQALINPKFLKSQKIIIARF